MTLRIHATFAGVLLTSTAVLAQASPAASQSPAPPAAARQPPSPSAKAREGEAGSGYAYDPQGRRDPFVSLLRRGLESDRTRLAARPAGISGLEVSEVMLKGTLESRSGYVALVVGTDMKTYIIKPGDRLLDGTVQKITSSAIVILQQVNDPLSQEKQREVRKTLRQTDEVK